MPVHFKPVKTARRMFSRSKAQVQYRISGQKIAKAAAAELENIVRDVTDTINTRYEPLYEGSNYRNGREPYYSVFKRRDDLYKWFEPKTSFSVDVETSGDKTVIRLRLFLEIQDGRGQPNNLWYWLNNGTSAHTQMHTSPRIPLPGGGYYVARAFTTQPGITPRNYTNGIYADLVRWFKDKYGREWDISVQDNTGTVRHRVSERIGSNG